MPKRSYFPNVKIFVHAYSRILYALPLIVFLGIQPSAQPQAGAGPIFAVALPDGTLVELGFYAEPRISGCRRTDFSEEGQSWICSDYALELSVGAQEGADLISFEIRHLEGLPFRLREQSARVLLPLYEGDALWTFNRQAVRDIMETDLNRPWFYYSAANRGIPYLALVDRQGQNRIALGLLGQDHTALMRGEVSGDKKHYALTLRQTDNAVAEVFADTIYVSHDDLDWFRDAQRYTALVDRSRGYVPPAMPDGVLNPTYDSWYWSLDRIDQDLTWELAKRSRALGFRTYLIDAGWDTRPGEYVKGMRGSTGNYLAPKETFPDFAGLIGDIRNRLGMKVMLWMQQYALGRRSFYHPRLSNALCLVGDPEFGPLAETPFLCPRTYATRRHMGELFRRILEDYKPDALWFDWQEEIPQTCSAPHYHEYERFGDGYNATQQTIMEIIRQIAPDVFVDMRWPFANLNNKAYTHLWQPIDSAGDFEAMRLRAMVMRPFSAGIVMGTDEMYWDPKISDSEAARFMAAVVFTGVPYFGPNLLEEPASRGARLRGWLEFYEANKEDLVGGDFRPYGDSRRPDQYIEGDRAAFVYYGNRYRGPVRFSRPVAQLHVVNASPLSGIDLWVIGLEAGRYRAQISDLDLGSEIDSRSVQLPFSTRLRFEVPVGCLLTLVRMP